MIPRILQLTLSWLYKRIARKGKEIHDADILAHRAKMIATGRLKLPYGKPQGFKPTPIIPVVRRPTKASIRQLASRYKDEYDMQLDAARYLYHEVMANGGIRPYKHEYLQEEYTSNVPRWYRRKDGLPPDEMAETLFYDSDSDLYTAIADAEMKRQQLLANAHPYKFYLLQAAQDLHDELNPE